MLAENALFAKAKAMYAKRLTKQDYQNMLDCKTVSEVATYLKNKTFYSEYLQKLNTSSIHRGWFELNLKQAKYQNFEKLSHYEYTLGSKFYEYFVIKAEIDEIMQSITLIHTGNKQQYLLTLPGFFIKHSSVDLTQLEKVKNIDAFIDLLKGTDYEKLCLKCINEEKQTVNVLLLSTTLEQYKYDKLLNLVKKNVNYKDRKTLNEFIKTEIDIINIQKIYRTSQFLKNNIDILASSVLLEGGALNPQHLRAIAHAQTLKDLVREVEKTSYKRYMKDTDLNLPYVEQFTKELMYRKCRHEFYFSTHPLLVIASYTYLFEQEIENIIHITEGKRYLVPNEKVRQFLIGADE